MSITDDLRERVMRVVAPAKVKAERERRRQVAADGIAEWRSMGRPVDELALQALRNVRSEFPELLVLHEDITLLVQPMAPEPEPDAAEATEPLEPCEPEPAEGPTASHGEDPIPAPEPDAHPPAAERRKRRPRGGALVTMHDGNPVPPELPPVRDARVQAAGQPIKRRRRKSDGGR